VKHPRPFFLRESLYYLKMTRQTPSTFGTSSLETKKPQDLVPIRINKTEAALLKTRRNEITTAEPKGK
jgi:hypothetical protein